MEFSYIMKTASRKGVIVVRCQYCGKNLWPLRGLFDEDFCSRDHRQRYHERVRKALEHLPKGQPTPRPNGIAGFQFEKPRLEQPEFTRRPTTDTVAPAVSANIMSIDSMRARFEPSQGALAAVAWMDTPAPIAPRPGNITLKASRRWSLSPEAFDELNHVYLHEPDPFLEANMPFGGPVISRLKPVSSTPRAKHTAIAGPSGAGRVEFFPMRRHTPTALAEGREAEALPE